MVIKNKILTIEDVKKLNSDSNSSVILINTAGQSSDIIRQLAPHVKIQVIGGYDGEKKDKYKEKRIQDRTYYSASDLANVIDKFEVLEKGIDPSWTDLEKALYVYLNLAQSITYYKNDLIKDRNLCTILGSGVCAGYASVFKEAMDRLGIESEVLNQSRTHTWNAIKIDGKWYPLDLTLDSVEIKDSVNEINWFGQKSHFDKYNSHQANNENIDVPNNCFNRSQLESALQKVSMGSEIVLGDELDSNLDKYYKIAKEQSKNCSSEEMNKYIETVSKTAFLVKSSYDWAEYNKIYDPIFLDFYRNIKNNPNLTDEEKEKLLRQTNSYWLDVMAGDSYLAKSKSELVYMLRCIYEFDNNFNHFEDCEKLYNLANKIIQEKCMSYGVIDPDLINDVISELNTQLITMRESAYTDEIVVDENKRVTIEGPIEILKLEPILERDMEKFWEWRITQLNTLLKDLRENEVGMNEGITEEGLLRDLEMARLKLYDEQSSKKWYEEHFNK